jgi:hypothetical protein
MTIPSDAMLARFLEQLTVAAHWPSHCVITTPPNVAFTALLLDVFRALVSPDDDAAKLPSRPSQPLVGDSVGYASVDQAYFTPRGDGVLTTTAPRGFMPGMGATLRYSLLVAEEIVIESEDYWEDNIADPDAAEFNIRAISEAPLECAIKTLTHYLSTRGVPFQMPAGAVESRDEGDEDRDG